MIQRIMKTYAVVQCVAWPCWGVCSWLLLVDNEMIHLLSPSLNLIAVFTLRFAFTIIRCYVGFNSLIIAICRYCFIVFDEKTSKYGIQNARRIFISASIGIPLLVALSNEAATPIEYHPWIIYMHNDLELTRNSYINNTYFNANEIDDTFQSPIYRFANRYFPTVMTYGVKLFCMAAILLIFSNISEGILYLHTYIYCRR